MGFLDSSVTGAINGLVYGFLAAYGGYSLVASGGGPLEIVGVIYGLVVGVICGVFVFVSTVIDWDSGEERRRVLNQIDQRIQRKKNQLEEVPDIAGSSRASIGGRIAELELLRSELDPKENSKEGGSS